MKWLGKLCSKAFDLFDDIRHTFDLLLDAFLDKLCRLHCRLVGHDWWTPKNSVIVNKYTSQVVLDYQCCKRCSLGVGDGVELDITSVIMKAPGPLVLDDEEEVIESKPKVRVKKYRSIDDE